MIRMNLIEILILSNKTVHLRKFVEAKPDQYQECLKFYPIVV